MSGGRRFAIFDELRECPATATVGAIWILLFMLAQVVQGQFRWAGSPLIGPGALLASTSHILGDLTWRDVFQGQVWRLTTAPFVHMSFMHLVINLVGLYQLGRLIEPWYGSRQFVLICIVIGGLGNLLGGSMRLGGDLAVSTVTQWGLSRFLPGFLRLPPGTDSLDVHSAGGSTTILGLIGLAAVVGTRSRTRYGAFLRDQMIGFLVFMGCLGLLFSNLVDSYGHAGGAIAGCLVGFFHRRLVKGEENPTAQRVAGAASAVVLLLCAYLQIGVASVELSARREQLASLASAGDWERRRVAAEEVIRISTQIAGLYETLATRSEESAPLEFQIALPTLPRVTIDEQPNARVPRGVLENLLRAQCGMLENAAKVFPPGDLPDAIRSYTAASIKVVETSSTSKDRYAWQIDRARVMKLAVAERSGAVAKLASFKIPKTARTPSR